MNRLMLCRLCMHVDFCATKKYGARKSDYCFWPVPGHPPYSLHKGKLPEGYLEHEYYSPDWLKTKGKMQ